MAAKETSFDHGGYGGMRHEQRGVKNTNAAGIMPGHDTCRYHLRIAGAAQSGTTSESGDIREYVWAAEVSRG